MLAAKLLLKILSGVMSVAHIPNSKFTDSCDEHFEPLCVLVQEVGVSVLHVVNHTNWL